MTFKYKARSLEGKENNLRRKRSEFHFQVFLIEMQRTKRYKQWTAEKVKYV